MRKPQPNNGTPYIWEGTGKAEASHTGRGWGLSVGSETGQANLEIAVSLSIDPPSGSYSLSLGGETSYPITVVDGDGTHTDKASVSWDDPPSYTDWSLPTTVGRRTRSAARPSDPT